MDLYGNIWTIPTTPGIPSVPQPTVQETSLSSPLSTETVAPTHVIMAPPTVSRMDALTDGYGNLPPVSLRSQRPSRMAVEVDQEPSGWKPEGVQEARGCDSFVYQLASDGDEDGDDTEEDSVLGLFSDDSGGDDYDATSIRGDRGFTSIIANNNKKNNKRKRPNRNDTDDDDDDDDDRVSYTSSNDIYRDIDDIDTCESAILSGILNKTGGTARLGLQATNPELYTPTTTTSIAEEEGAGPVFEDGVMTTTPLSSSPPSSPPLPRPPRLLVRSPYFTNDDPVTNTTSSPSVSRRVTKRRRLIAGSQPSLTKKRLSHDGGNMVERGARYDYDDGNIGDDTMTRDGSGLFVVNTDCCPGLDRYEEEEEEEEEGVRGRRNPRTDGDRQSANVWCFGCQWGAKGHRPVDNQKIAELATCFMNLILHGSTGLENIGRLISDMYRITIRNPSIALGRWMPDWPPRIVQRHIENMTEPRVVTALLIRRQLALLHRISDHTFQRDVGSGEVAPNLPVIRALFQGTRELRELYKQVPKGAFGYNETLRAESWSGGVLVHPSRVQRPGQTMSYPGAPTAAHPGRAGVRQSAVSDGGQDTGALRGPANDEELIRRGVRNGPI